MVRIFSLLAPCLVALSASLASATEPVRLAPHRASYDLELQRTAQNDTVTAANGRIVLEFLGDACEGYGTKFQQVLQITNTEGQQRGTDLRSMTWEAGDGSSYKYRIETESGRDTEQKEGSAERSADGGVSVEVRRPQPSRVDLEGEGLFPTAHMKRLIETARAGERLLDMKVFDGSETNGRFYDTLGLIGPRVPEGGRAVEPIAAQAGLAGMARWPVRISYFETGPGERTPVLVMAYDLFENGVSGNLSINFGTFALKGTLSRLELLPASACRK
jgi:EipB-like